MQNFFSESFSAYHSKFLVVRLQCFILIVMRSFCLLCSVVSSLPSSLPVSSSKKVECFCMSEFYIIHIISHFFSFQKILVEAFGCLYGISSLMLYISSVENLAECL